MTSRRESERPEEMPAVRTTIVGGRPPGSGQRIGNVPRGLEVLVKKAAVDAEFREVLLAKRAAAAREIGLALEPAEAAMLGVIPSAQLEAIIENTKVNPKLRRAFMSGAAAVMIAALGAGSVGCIWNPVTDGIRPDVDFDGLPDDWELQHFASVEECDPEDDSDSDNLTNLGEYQAGTDPLDSDTDGDTISDGDEVDAGTDPLDPESP